MNNKWEGLNLAELVDLLEPVPEPAPISMMPQTAGWWVLGAMVFAATSLLAVRIRKQRKRSAYRRAALAELDACDGQPDELSALLRRGAMAAYPRTDVASLHGNAWLAFLDWSYGGTGFQNGAGRAVANAPYQVAHDPVPDLKPLVREWIKGHRGPAS